MRRAFTIMEVNLAILIMAGGILAMVSLYSLGYRENRQSREDVASAAIADAVMSPLVMACSATNLKWTVFSKLPNYPSDDGWAHYFNSSTGLVDKNPQSIAESEVFNKVMGDLRNAADGTLDVKTDFPSSAFSGNNMKCGLVVMHNENSPVIRIAFRATHQPGMLLSMPMYYTEVRFQGDPNK